jgi:integrase/recombinase XerD
MNTVLAFTPDLVRLYFTTETQRGNGMATLHRKLATLREFAKWCVAHRIVGEDPTRLFPNIKRPKTLPRPLTDDEVTRLLALPLPSMEHVLRVLLLNTGLRATPLTGLRVGDVVEGPPPHLRVISKGAKPHTRGAPAGDVRAPALLILAETDLKPQTWLFPKQRAKVTHPIGRRELEDMAHRWGEAAGVPTCLPHRFRHTYATGLLRGGADIRVVQELLAHEDIKSTMLYTAVAPPDRAKAVLRLPWKVGGLGDGER